MRLFLIWLVCGSLIVSVVAADKSQADNRKIHPGSNQGSSLKWIPLSDSRLEIRGLPWLATNAPDLWRLPKYAREQVPRAVWNRALAPDGGRIRLSSNTSRLGIRVRVLQKRGKPCFFDAYANGEFAGTASAPGTQPVDLVLFDKNDRANKDLTIYLPNNQEAQVLAIGLDPDAGLKSLPAFALPAPIICYGSSVLQGTGAAHPATTYPAALARRLNLDFVNLGFGGAGKAEPEVVQLVATPDACCYIFDLGKSYGNQPMEPYARMLDTIRTAHPNVPIFCVTPIYSTKENKEPEYHEKSEKLRALMRQAVTDRQKAGDKRIFVVEGLELFGKADEDAFNDPLHPNDEGNERIAKRLSPIVEKVLFGK